MTKAFIDSNIWVRPLVDSTSLAKACTQVIEACQRGLFKPYTSTIALLEVNHVLISLYKFKSKTATSIIQDILSTKNLILVESTNLKSALSLHQKTNIKLTDCIIATQIPPKTIAVTSDKHFTKFPNLITKNPDQLVKELSLN
jgi:predicted nucleic-acid-binding protein